MLFRSRSLSFPGFDGFLAFKHNETPVCIVFQVTIAASHPLARQGLAVLQQFLQKFGVGNVFIVYIVPADSSQSFKAQSLEKSEQKSAALFNSVVQFCMSINVYSGKRTSGDVDASVGGGSRKKKK